MRAAHVAKVCFFLRRAPRNIYSGSCHTYAYFKPLFRMAGCRYDLYMAAGQKCLELGCGTGVVGIAVCRSRAANIMLTDGNHAAVQNCECNLSLNGCKVDTPQTATPGGGQVSAIGSLCLLAVV